MKEKFEALKAWATNNKVMAAVIVFVVIAIIAKFGAKYMRKPRRRLRGARAVKSMGSARRRSVNTIIKSGPNRGKKAWQIKGSEAARRHMANIRRKRKK